MNSQGLIGPGGPLGVTFPHGGHLLPLGPPCPTQSTRRLSTACPFSTPLEATSPLSCETPAAVAYLAAERIAVVVSLNDRLEEMRQASWGKWPSHNRAIVERARDELARSGTLERALMVGAKAPDFSLPAVAGERVTLYHLLQSGPVVISFYRGRW